jgi:hypothetical protein
MNFDWKASNYKIVAFEKIFQTMLHVSIKV